MKGNWVLKVYIEPGKISKIKRICWRKTTKKQGNYFINCYIKKPKKEIKRLKKIGVKYSCYKVEFERASNYRNVFFARTKGPYMCRYCHRPLTKDKIYVDHVIPVSKTQKSAFARILLAIKGCNNVNDICNLAPACQKCNLKKSDKMGLWVIRGWLGKYSLYWGILKFIKISAIFLSVFIPLYFLYIYCV